ncbi:hypothetical protein TVAG_012480 [Trichomonas vaginalis G3]|uniref:Uncharacterized protein n=1 Tax=Trichomonas vaginalis (strain ATCC PRA-98 / G3) TaxID=412133 RepID=A2E8Z8_TRIV3|nr:uncharacterized protein TVAGG3_1075200 [Trichomonas vaginalis G3]EAY10882.1 hypothetical protein TVAG_012480 [Trichomonas vaginalis G3]KAI5482929.1 hypothetical protein TVAGG3_1075200 [Trichomonas vaginalis G3]|eukprot:XP_001323105.1 hypothetical protein [Trichomonas vaginalis G3]
MVSRVLKLALVEGVGFFLATCLVAILQALSIQMRIVTFILGGILLATVVALLFKSFWKHTEGDPRWYLFVPAIISLVAGLLYFIVSKDFYTAEKNFEKFIVYSVEMVAVGQLFALLLPFITKFLIEDSLKAAGIDYPQEAGAYIGFFTLLSVGQAAFFVFFTKFDANIWNSGFLLSIAAWFIGAILGAVVGYVFENRSSPLASAYVSTYDSNTYDASK